MKIINLSFEDSAGAAYTLSHALNKNGQKAINVRANTNYLNYPTIANLGDYDLEGARRLIEKADVVVFHTAIQPFYSSLHLTKEFMKKKKKLLYFHGSDCRNYGADILAQADEIMEDYEVLVSTPDLLRLVPQAHWMPCVRSFDEIEKTYSVSRRDQIALNAFGQPKTRLVLAHAPTNADLKGTSTFNRAITQVLEVYPHARYVPIQNVPWDSCMRTMSETDIFFDQCVLGAYGLAAVEAAIFKLPVFCRIDDGVAEVMEKESGYTNPFIQWGSDGELAERIMGCLVNKDLRKTFGKTSYEYCKKMHDENPVSTRFMNVVNNMPG